MIDSNIVPPPSGKSGGYDPVCDGIIAEIGSAAPRPDHDPVALANIYKEYLTRYNEKFKAGDTLGPRDQFLSWIESDRNNFFEKHLFPPNFDARLGFEDAFSADAKQKMMNSFMQDRRGLNLGERFALSLSPPYLGNILLAKLASTSHDSPGESERLYSEYCDLKRWFDEHGLDKQDPLPEDDNLWIIAARSFPSSHPDKPEDKSESVIVAMAYPLVANTIVTKNSEGERITVDFIIVKEVVVELSAVEYDSWMEQRYRKSEGAEKTVLPFDKASRVEELIYGVGQSLPLGLKRHYTAYYSGAVQNRYEES